MTTQITGQLYGQFVAKRSDIAVGYLNVIDGRIEHHLPDRPMEGETMVFVDRTTNKVIYAGTSTLNVNNLGRISNHNARDTSHDWLSVYIRKFCKHVDLFLMGDDRYDHLTLRSANKKAQIVAALDERTGDGSSVLRVQLAEADREIAALLKQVSELHAQRASICARLFAARG